MSEGKDLGAWRNRLAVWLANGVLRVLATKRYRAFLRGSILYGLRAAQEDVVRPDNRAVYRLLRSIRDEICGGGKTAFGEPNIFSDLVEEINDALGERPPASSVLSMREASGEGNESVTGAVIPAPAATQKGSPQEGS